MASTIRISIVAAAGNAVRGFRDTGAAADRLQVKIGGLDRALSRLDRRNPRVSFDTRGFVQGVAQIALAQIALDKLRNGFPDLSFGLAGLAQQATAVGAGLLALTGAALPLTGAIAGIAASATAAAAGVGLFAAVALPTIKSVTTAVGEYNTASHAFDRARSVGDTTAMATAQKNMASALGALSPAQRAAAKQALSMQAAWTKLSDSQAPLVLSIMAEGAKTLAGIIPRLTPAISAMAKVVKGISGQVFKDLSASVGPVVSLITSQGVPTLKALGTIVSNLVPTVLNLVTAFAPLGTAIIGQLVPISVALKGLNFGSLASAVTGLIPTITTLLTNLAGLVGNIGQAAAPLAGPVLQALSGIAAVLRDMFASADIKGFVANIGGIVPALAPIAGILAPALAKFARILSGQVMALVPRLIPLVSQVADALTGVLVGLSPLLPALLDLVGTFISLLPVLQPVITSLRTALIPVIESLGTALTIIAPRLPVLVEALGKVLIAAAPLIPVVAQLAAALAGMLAQALTALAPLIADFAAWATRNPGAIKAIAIAILALATAFKVVEIYTAAASVATNFWSGVQAISAAATKVWTGVQIASAAVIRVVTGSTVAMAAAIRIGMGVQLASAAATRVMTGVQLAAAAVVRGWMTAQYAALALTRLWTAQQIASAIASRAMTAAQVAASVATQVWTGVQWLLNAALIANPIGIVIVLVAALVAAIVYLATKTQFFQTVWSGLVGAFDWVKARFSDAVNWISSMGDKLAGVGSSIVQGLVDGITGAWHRVTDKLSSLTQLIPATVRQFLGIASPSRVMFALGEQTTLGLAGGLTRQLPALRASLSGLSGAFDSMAISPPTIGLTAGIAGSASSTSAIYHVTVNVAPGADLAEAGRQTVKAIEAHERQSGRRRLAPAL